MIRWLAIFLVTLFVAVFTKSWFIAWVVATLMIFNRRKIENWIYDSIDKSKKR